ncbi:MAG TPA: rhodanese-like domain-containing protein [Nitrospiraceae bacterium]|nr:rhodanese-like domain-containing protein [Nitrospiraceae bacterium]
MTLRVIIAIAGLLLLSAISISGVSAHHSYLLTVQQLRDGLTKTPSMPQKGFILIDVRSAEEHAAGFIPGTDLNIEFREIQARHREIGAQLEDHLVVYCQSGHRSNIAAETLADLGYRHVYNVTGSMNAWLAAGYPVEPARR